MAYHAFLALAGWRISALLKKADYCASTPQIIPS